MAFHLFRPSTFLGVDVGTSSIKVVELSLREGKPVLKNYGSVSLEAEKNPGIGTNISLEEKKRDHLHALLRRLKPHAKDAYVSLPGANGLVALLEFPPLKDKELKQAIQFEAKKYVPAEMEDVVLSWDILARPRKKFSFSKKEKKDEEKEEVTKVLLVAALKKDVLRLERLFQGTGISIKSIELETFSLVRSLVHEKKGAFLVVDIGFKITNFVLVENGIIRVNRSIDAGGGDITRSIAESMNISFSRAETFKKEGNDLFHQKEMSLILPSVSTILNETNRIMRMYKERTKEDIHHIILSGGSGALAGLDTYIQEKTHIPTEQGNPWKNILFPKKLKPFLEDMKGSYAVAVGLALRGIEENR